MRQMIIGKSSSSFSRSLWLLALSICSMQSVSGVASQEIVYINRSELWAFEQGQQFKQGAQAVNDFNAHMARRAADYQSLKRMKGRISACGSCADRVGHSLT